ncbi:MAG: hypothetical protein GWO44_09665, partial [Thermoplasmata archaeon]|nr:hypothetical protein [Thermoplasmata archaeon]NIY03538.1 hypothetical protein [Thermoplasmata archaeon]
EILEGEFPFRAVASFEPLLEFWKQVAEEGGSPVREHLARTILDKVEGVEALRGDIEDIP